MDDELKPLPKKITDEIRQILEGCRDGKLNHIQNDYHCGTAHCIAGWKAVFDYAKSCGNKQIAFEDYGWGSPELDHWMRDTEKVFAEDTYAQKVWNLTDEEARTLFNEKATFPEQFALLEKLEAGERVP